MLNINWLYYCDVGASLNIKSILDKKKERMIYSINTPIGIWLSFEDDYRKNAFREEIIEIPFSNEYYIHIFNFDIPNQNLLKLSSILDLIQFSETYSSLILQRSFTNWQQVMKDYDGIILLNLKKIKKLILLEKDIRLVKLLSWYLGLNSSCACIFNTDILEKITYFKNIDYKPKSIIR
ncbi:MAG: hypothetical protein ACRCZI_03940 [Cetobacterium sp.]